MATTKELASFVLENDPELKEWFEKEHGFTVEKAKNGNLDDYQDLLGVIIREGVNKNVISQAQADGTEDLKKL